jgi:hypothetical protein
MKLWTTCTALPPRRPAAYNRGLIGVDRQRRKPTRATADHPRRSPARLFKAPRDTDPAREINRKFVTLVEL